MNAGLVPLSVFIMTDLCKTGSATVTMVLFVAEKCTFENSANPGTLALKPSCAYGVSPLVGSIPTGTMTFLCSNSSMDSRATVFLGQGTSCFTFQEIPASEGLALLRGVAGWVPPGTMKTV